jgi:hypothetical protein
MQTELNKTLEPLFDFSDYVSQVVIVDSPFHENGFNN